MARMEMTSTELRLTALHFKHCWLFLVPVMVMCCLWPNTAFAEDDDLPTQTIVGSGVISNQGVRDFLSSLNFGFSARFEGGGGSVENGDEDSRQEDKDCADNESSGVGSNGNGTSGNPVVLSTGNKIDPEMDFISRGEMGLSLVRTYNRHWAGVGIFGKHWLSNVDYKLSFGTSQVNSCYPRPGGGTCGIGVNTVIWAHRPDGKRLRFFKNASDGIFYEEKPAPVAKIVKQSDGSFVLYNEDNFVERYSSAGYVTDIKNEQGNGWIFGYSGTYPVRITHTSGRYVDLIWASGQLTSVRDPAGNYYGYAYLTNRFGAGLHLLSATSRPGSPATAIAYHYENASQLGALTGKSYGGVRYSWYDYSPNGKVISTEHAGGKDRYTFTYAANGEGVKFTTETNPLGKQTSYSFQNGSPVSVQGFASTHCFANYREYNLDANGYDDVVSDFNGNLVDYDYNAKGQLIKQVDAVGTPLARTTLTTWDTTRNRILSIVVAGLKRADIVYDADNRVSSITITNLSVNGVANQSRTTTYAYTEHVNGMLATMTVDGPLSGNGDAVVSSYSPYGDLMSIANSLGHATTYSSHNGLGEPGRITGPNGDIVDIIYDAQGRTTTLRRWIAGVAADTVNAYNAQGLLASVAAADGATTNYEYDAARRLIRTWRSANGTVAGGASKEDQLYTYDLMGNITRVDNRKLVGHYETQCKRWMTIEGALECVEEEQIWVEVPTITQTAFVDYDESGRVRARRGNHSQNVRYAYDDNGNVKTITDSSNRSTAMTYDALGRLSTSTDPLNAVTRFEYNADDRIIKVVDPRNLNTTYVYDGFGRLWAQSSPDTGVSTFQHNATGQLTGISRADGTDLVYAYDVIGRLTWYGTSLQGRAYGYDWCQNGKGRLCEANYGDGSRHYGYTPQGQTAVTRDFTAGLATDDWTGYSYDTVGRVTGISYPSGVSVGYGYSGGKLTLMNTTTANGVSNVIAGSINYHPFGGISNWTYGNNLQRLTPVDLDGRPTAIHTDGIQGLYYQHNANDEITKITNGADAGLTQDYAYDALSRVTSQTMPGNSMILGYDGVGNRTSRNDNGVPTTYGYPATNHHLLSAAAGGNTRWFNTNAVGNIDAWHDADGQYNATTYDAYLRPKTHTRNGFTTTYRFNAQDQRMLKYLGGGNSTRYVYAGQNTMLAERFTSGNGIGSQWTSYLWLGGQPVGLVKGNTLYWVHGDHLGRPEMVTNTSQQRVWRAANRAFERGIALNQIGGYNLGFPGQYYDSESNLWHNGFRDYEPTIGRYMQSDPIGLAGGISTYGYVGASPVLLVDPFGLSGLVLGGPMSMTRMGRFGPATLGSRVPWHMRPQVRIQPKGGKPKTDTPSWARGSAPRNGEKPTEFARRVCEEAGQSTKEGPTSAFNQLKKFAETHYRPDGKAPSILESIESYFGGEEEYYPEEQLIY